MQLTNQEEKYRAAANPSWSHVQGLRLVRHTKQPALTKATGNDWLPMQHTKEVVISADYNWEEALISTNQCLARLIVTFLVKLCLTLSGRQIPSSICLRTLIKFRKNRCLYFVNLLNIKHSLVYQRSCCIKWLANL